MEKTPKRVWTPKGAGKEIAKRFGVTNVFVSAALNGRRNSATARNIRAVAIRDFGGKSID